MIFNGMHRLEEAGKFRDTHTIYDKGNTKLLIWRG